MNHQHIRDIIRKENEEMWHERNPEAMRDSSHAHRISHTASFGDVVGHDAHANMVTAFHNAFTDHHMRIEHLVVEGENAAYRVVHRAKHTGTFFGIAPTGNDVSVTMCNFARFEGDRIAELWTTWDTLVLFRQIGVAIPVPFGEV